MTRTWTGVRLRDLAALAGVPVPDDGRSSSRSRPVGAFARATLQSRPGTEPGRAAGPEGRQRGRATVDLAPDHGYPARVIVPGAARRPQHQVGLVDRLQAEGGLMRAALRFWRYLYGENPLHLLVMVGCFALVGYVVSFVYPGPEALALLIWFAGAVLAHDLVLYPLYALADQPLVIGRWARRRVLPRHPPLVPAINHVRVPVLGSAVLGLDLLPHDHQPRGGRVPLHRGAGHGGHLPALAADHRGAVPGQRRRLRAAPGSRGGARCAAAASRGGHRRASGRGGRRRAAGRGSVRGANSGYARGVRARGVRAGGIHARGVRASESGPANGDAGHDELVDVEHVQVSR